MADEYEEKNVHEVYQQIAGHFSATRYKVCETNETKQILNPAIPLYPNQATRSIRFESSRVESLK